MKQKANKTDAAIMQGTSNRITRHMTTSQIWWLAHAYDAVPVPVPASSSSATDADVAV